MDTKKLIKVLVVEDELVVAKGIEKSLRDLGYIAVGIAHSGEKAIEIIPHAQPDLVLMDIGLKGPTDGMFAAQRIRTRFDIPVIYLTAHSDDETLKRAIHSRPYDYIVKPFGDQELHDAIEQALNRHRTKQGIKDRD